MEFGAPLGLDPIDYVDALYTADRVQVALSGGRTLVLDRAGLGHHQRLEALGRKIVSAPLEKRVEWLREWLRVAGVDDLGALGLSDLLRVVKAARALNRRRGRLAWDLLPPERERDEQATDYPGRGLARIVDTLARHYGWSLDAILALAPEVAAAHVQECVLADRRRREWEHYLSEIAWEYDKGNRKSRYRPLPPLPWERLPVRRTHTPIPAHIVEKYYPKGVVVDLTAPDVVREAAAGPAP